MTGAKSTLRRGPGRTAAAVLAVVLAAAGLAAGPAHAQSKAGTTVGGFLRIEPNARGAALGNAGSALPGGIESAWYNCGAIGMLEQPAVVYSHSFWFADIGFNYAAAALPVGGIGNFLVSVTALNSGEIDVRTVDQPLGTGERYTVSNTAIGLGYGLRITSRFAAGLQANYATERIWHTSVGMVTFNLGTVYRLTEGGAVLGFSLSNLGARASYDGDDLSIRYDADPDVYGDNSGLPAEQYTDNFPLPGVFRLGLGVPYRLGEDSDLLLLLEALHPNDNSESANLGVEWAWKGLFALRGGYQTLFQEDRQLGLTLGFGVGGVLGGNRYQVDYAWAGHRYLQDTHRFSVVFAY
ncbi:MAG: PorV/PorQ family protein [Krumholzibacteria bacterium]|nr:PorV/PorQ family protein [Candidatus Krumholzibacteria bacterium]